MKDLTPGMGWDDPTNPATQWDTEWEHWDKADSDEFIRMVQRGRQGHNVGIEDGSGRINKYLHGTHQGRYYLLGADSGVGKSTRADFKLWNIWYNAKKRGIPLDIHYYSFEMAKINKIANWTAYVIHSLYDIEMPSEYIMSRIEGRSLSDADMKRIKVAYSIVKEFMGCMRFYEGATHPTGFLINLIDNYYEKPEIGTVHRLPSTEKGKKGYIVGFTPRDPRRMTVIAMDHLALGHEEKGLIGTKAVIDKFSMYGVQLRNIFNSTILYIQQFNTELNSTFRLNRKNDAVLAPQRLDFGDSKYTYRDADVVEGLFKPIQFDVPKFQGYDVTSLSEYLIFNFLMKNRYGVSNRAFPMFFNPMGGKFYDLPLEPNNLILMDPWYTEALRLKNII